MTNTGNILALMCRMILSSELQQPTQVHKQERLLMQIWWTISAFCLQMLKSLKTCLHAAVSKSPEEKAVGCATLTHCCSMSFSCSWCVASPGSMAKGEEKSNSSFSIAVKSWKCSLKFTARNEMSVALLCSLLWQVFFVLFFWGKVAASRSFDVPIQLSHHCILPFEAHLLRLQCFMSAKNAKSAGHARSDSCGICCPHFSKNCPVSPLREKKSTAVHTPNWATVYHCDILHLCV